MSVSLSGQPTLEPHLVDLLLKFNTLLWVKYIFLQVDLAVRNVFLQ